MKKKHLLFMLALMLSTVFCFANTGGKEKKEDPDMTGYVVEAETGKPIKDVNITAYNSSRKEKATTSSSNGCFSLADLKPGVYKFVFEKEGFEKVIREKMILKTNEGYQLNIQMIPEQNIFDLMPSPLRFSSGD